MARVELAGISLRMAEQMEEFGLVVAPLKTFVLPSGRLTVTRYRGFSFTGAGTWQRDLDAELESRGCDKKGRDTLVMGGSAAAWSSDSSTFDFYTWSGAPTLPNQSLHLATRLAVII